MSIQSPPEPNSDAAKATNAGVKRLRPFRDYFVIAAVTLILLVLWESAVRLWEVPQFVLPPPSDVLGRLAADFTSGVLIGHFSTTLIEVVAGFVLAAIIGVGLGCAIGLVSVVERIVYPYVLALQTIPKVAIAPLMIIWVGFGIQSKIVTAGLIAFFPILVNVVAGIKTVEPRRILLMRALKASPWQTFIKVRLPSMLPYLFAGFEVGIIFAVIGAIVGEFLGSSRGLGSLVIQRQAAIDVAGVFSVLFYLSVMGIALNLILRSIAKRYAFWSHRSDAGEHSA
jgi:NitT/TauT family transport system permease protein